MSIALSALVVSAFTAYFNFFREITEVKVIVLNFIASEKNDADSLTQLVFLNKGNQGLLITTISSIAGTDRKLKNGSFGAQVNLEVGRFPIYVDKGAMLVISVSTPLKFTLGNSPDGVASLYYGLKISSLDSRGRKRCSKVMFAEIDLANRVIGQSSYQDKEFFLDENDSSCIDDLYSSSQ